MKVKFLFVIAAIGFPVAMHAQGSFLYNQGKMVVKGDNPANTVLYIKGDFISGSKSDGTNVVGGDVNLMPNSRTVLTGNLYHDVPVSATAARVFDVDSKGIFEFRGSAKQLITTNGATYSNIPNKGTSYIDFPTLVINNPNTVAIDPTLAAKADTVNLTKGTLVLTSERITAANSGKYNDTSAGASVGSASAVSNLNDRTALSHLLAGTVNYTNTANSVPAAERSFIEVDLALDESGSYTYLNGKYASLVGMGIPFKGLKSDYFTWNYLLTPIHSNYFGPNNKPVNTTDYSLKPGVGYFIGNELAGTNYDDYLINDFSLGADGSKGDGMGPLKFDARFKGGYIFNRTAFANMTNSNNVFGAYNVASEAYNEERLNTGDVTVSLHQGYNYLANPYTSPLDISALLTASPTRNSWGVISGTSATPNKELDYRVWIPTGSSKGSAHYNMIQNAGQDVLLAPDKIQVNVVTQLAAIAGGTYIDEDGQRPAAKLIPPLQMFIVYAYQPVTITIPQSARVMGKNQFIRSANNISTDDFVFEVYDKATNSKDRVSVVLRPKNELLDGSLYSDVKKNTASVTLDDNNIKSTDDSNLSQGISSQLYTVGSKNEKLLLKFVPYTKDVDSKIAVPLNLVPSTLDQDIVIRGLTLNTLTNFDNVILEDKLLNKQTVLTPETEYSTSVKSTDSENRFVLYFTKGTTGIEDEINNNTSKSIYSNYSNGTLTVGGFDEKDFGSSLSVFDIQGRLITQTKVNDFTVTIRDNFNPGAFIVKVVGNNTYVAKFLVK